MERLTRIELAASTVAWWRSDLLSYNRLERTAGVEPASSSWGDDALPKCVTSAWSHHRDSNPGPRPYRGRALPAELRRPGVPGAIRTRTTQLLGLVPPTVLGYEDMRASDRIRPGDLLLTRELLCQLSYRGDDPHRRMASPTRGPAGARTALLHRRRGNRGAATP